jgi:hypothetical protein
MLALFAVVGAPSLSQAGPPQAVQVAPSVPARQPVRAAAPQTPPNQPVIEPAQTKIVRIYRGDGYFDMALAEKVRSVLAKNSGPTPSPSSPTPAESFRAAVGSADSLPKSLEQKTVAQAGRP